MARYLVDNVSIIDMMEENVLTRIRVRKIDPIWITNTSEPVWWIKIHFTNKELATKVASIIFAGEKMENTVQSVKPKNGDILYVAKEMPDGGVQFMEVTMEQFPVCKGCKAKNCAPCAVCQESNE